MSIYLNKDSKIIVQGMTGGMGTKHTTLMLDAGTNIVGGVNARKAGDDRRARRPGAARSSAPSRRRWPRPAPTCRCVFVPPAFTKDACIEAIDAGIGLLVVITEGVPVQDTAEVWAYLERQGHPDDRAELPRHHHARASRWPASRRTPSPARARSGWSRSPAR